MSRPRSPLRLLPVVLLAALAPGVAAAQGPVPGAEASAARPEAAPPLLAPGTPGDGAVVFLVRHAEKADEPASDPPLTAEGRERARTLASLLADAGIDAVWSTDFERTRATAAPFAERTGVPVTLYDPGSLAAFATRLKDDGGRSLVVGHSNTTPALVGLLGGEPGPPIDEAREYDRLYIVTLTSGGPVTTLLRFGRALEGG